MAAEPTQPGQKEATGQDRLVHLRGDGVSLVLDAREGLPWVVHWGADLGELTDDSLSDLAASARPQTRPGGQGEPAAAIVPEASAPWYGLPGVVGHRDTVDWALRFEVTTVAVVNSPAAQTAIVEAADADLALALRTEVSILAGGLVSLASTLTNTGAAAYTLDGLHHVLPVPAEAGELLDFTGRWIRERVPQRHAFTAGAHVREHRRGKPGFDSQVLYAAGTPGFGFGHGEVWGIHLGWSGNQRVYAERLPNGVSVLGAGELLLPGEVVLEPGESYQSPDLYAAHGIGLDQVSGRFHTWLRSRSLHPSSPRPVICNTWEAVYFDHDLDRLTELADAAAAVGAERYVLDDGWFGSRRNDRSGLGDWVVSDDAWPDGLGPLVDHVTGLGMQFGLWFEPEMVNPDSDVARAHPDWILRLPHRMASDQRHQQVLNLGNPGAFAHVLGQMDALLSSYDIGYVKWDHNRELYDAGDLPSGRPGVHAQTLATYALLDELKNRHPGLEIESCSSGGARVDLGILQHTDRVWGSDCIDAFERQSINRWTAALLPPELIGSHVGGPVAHTTGRTHSLAFRAGTALLYHFGIEWDITRAGDESRAELAGWVELYKRFRSLAHTGRFVRADHPDPLVWVTGVVAHDGSEGLYTVAAMGLTVVANAGRLRLPGLDAERTYTVEVVTTPEPADLAHGGRRTPPEPPSYRLPGRALASAGIQLPMIRPDSILLLYVSAN